MISKLEEIINQIIKEIGIPQENLVELLKATLRLLLQVPKIAKHPKTVIEQITDDQELNRETIKIYYSSLIEILRKFVNMLAYHWKRVQSTNQSPETIINTRQVILEELINFLTLFGKEHVHLLRHIAELEDYSGEFERADENIFKTIWQDIQDKSLDEEATKDLAFLLTNSSGGYKSRLLSLKERYGKLLKESTIAIQKIEEIEKIISRMEVIKRTTEEIRQTIKVIKQIIETEPLNLEDLSLKVEYLCKYIDIIGKAKEERKEEIPIPLREINDECLEPILKKVNILPKDSKKECVMILLKINDRLLNFFSLKDSKKFMNLFDRIEYLRLHEDLWKEFGFKECIKEVYELGEKIYADISSYGSEYSDKQKLGSFLGEFGEICRDMVEFKVCNPTEERGLLLKSNDFLQTSIIRDGNPVIEYFGRSYSRTGRNYIDLRQWEDSIKCFMEIKDIDNTKRVDKKIAFEARVNIADCYLNLGLEARKYRDIEGASQNFKLAEEFFNRANELPKLSPEDGRHLIGKQANFYCLSQQYEKALPLYKEIMQRELSRLPKEKNLYDCFSYRWGECLYQVENVDESIKQFETNLKRNPMAEHRIKSYVWLIKLYSIQHNWDKLAEIKEEIINDKEIKDIPIYGVSTDKLEVLLLTNKMEEYIAQIDDRLACGEAWEVIDELRNIIRLHSLMEGHDDPVLLTKIAEADIRVGDYGLALNILYQVMELDQRPKNQTKALAYIGRAHMEQGEYREAIEAFQKSFKLGGDIGMLVLQATAFRKLKEYDKSIELYEQILQSKIDKKPNITKTGLAKTYWDKYQYEEKKEDLEKALSHLVNVISIYPEDWQACNLLVKISSNTNIFNLIESLIKEGSITASRDILMELIAEDLFPDKAIHACLKRLSLIDPTDIDYWLFVQSSVDFLMRSTIYSYFFLSKDYFNKTLKDIFSSILNINDWHNILREYLCAEKGAYLDFFEKKYATQVEAILKPLSIQNIDLNLVLTEVIQSIRDFIQSEIPQDISTLYKGLESKGVDFTNMLMRRFYEVQIQKEDCTYILKHPKGIQLSMEIPYPAFYMFEKLTDWFHPLYSGDKWEDKGIWKNIFSHSNEILINLEIYGVDNIEVHFIAKLIYTDEKAVLFKTAFEAIRANHRVCPIPQMSWFQYKFSESLIEEENYSLLNVMIKMPKCIKLEDNFQKLIPFLNYMISSFKDGLCGMFRTEEYRRMATKTFPVNIDMGVEQYIEFIYIYLDHHFGLLFDSVLKNDQYRHAVHDCIKTPLGWISGTSEQEKITDFLINVEHLPWELGRIRRRTLESITTKSSIRKLNIEKLLEQLIDALQEKNTDINFEFFPTRYKLVEGVEPLLKKAFTNLYSNAIFATKALNRSKISTFIFEEEGYCVISIQNSYGENMPSAPFSTQIGLKSAEYIIKKEHKGEINTSLNYQKSIFTAKVKLPFAI